MARRLNLGCGKEILSGWDNLDRIVMGVVCRNVMEHVDYH